MSDPFQHSAARLSEDSRLDRLARRSALAASRKYYGSREASLVVTLGGGPVDSWDSSIVMMAIQKATAKLGHLISDPSSDDNRALRQYREKAPLRLLGQNASTMVFGFPKSSLAMAPQVDAFEGVTLTTLSERAVLDLVTLLPEHGEDDTALDSVLVRRRVERSAVSDIVKAVHETSHGIQLVFEPKGLRTDQTFPSQLSVDQAETLRDSLRQTEIERKVIHVRGTLDGMRTKRRLFYLEQDNGPSIQGAVGDDLLPQLRMHMSRHVHAIIEEVRYSEKSGKRGRPSYSLMSISGSQTAF